MAEYNRYLEAVRDLESLVRAEQRSEVVQQSLHTIFDAFLSRTAEYELNVSDETARAVRAFFPPGDREARGCRLRMAPFATSALGLG